MGRTSVELLFRALKKLNLVPEYIAECNRQSCLSLSVQDVKKAMGEKDRKISITPSYDYSRFPFLNYLGINVFKSFRGSVFWKNKLIEINQIIMQDVILILTLKCNIKPGNFLINWLMKNNALEPYMESIYLSVDDYIDYLNKKEYLWVYFCQTGFSRIDVSFSWESNNKGFEYWSDLNVLFKGEIKRILNQILC